MLLLLLACSDYSIHPASQAADPVQYQTAVLDFMCSSTCAWEGEPDCWSTLSDHWGFCLSGDEVLDPGLVEDCMALMDAARADGECTWLPEECTVSAVASRLEGADCPAR